LPITADALASSIVGSGWAVTGMLSHVGYIHAYCWECAEKELPTEILEDNRRVSKQIRSFVETTKGRHQVS